MCLATTVCHVDISKIAFRRQVIDEIMPLAFRFNHDKFIRFTSFGGMMQVVACHLDISHGHLQQIRIFLFCLNAIGWRKELDELHVYLVVEVVYRHLCYATATNTHLYIALPKIAFDSY